MSGGVEDFEVGRRVLARIEGSTGIRTLGQVARAENLSDDKVPRTLTRLSGLVRGSELTETRQNRLRLTGAGRQFLSILKQLEALGQAAASRVEEVRLVVGCGVPAELVRAVVAGFVNEWSGLVTLRVAPAVESVPDLVATAQADLGVVSSLSDPDPEEQLAALPLVVVIPAGHRMAGFQGRLDPDHFSATDDRVLFPFAAREAALPLIARVPEVHRVCVENPHVLSALVAGGVGIGFEYEPGDCGAGVTRVPVPDARPRTLGLVLPKKRDRLTDPVLWLADALRRAARELVAPAAATEAKTAPVSEPITEPESLTV